MPSCRADQIGLAERVAAAHPGMAQFVIGAKRYQGDTDGSLRRCAGDPTPTVPALPTGIPIVPVGQAPPGAVGAADVDHAGAVRGGDDVEAVVELRSDRTFAWTPTSIEPVAGVVVRAGTDEVVGAEVVRFSRLMLPAPVTAGPGEPLQITVTAATASADTSDDPALAPGDYEIVASVDIDGQQHLLPRVPFTIE